MKLGFIGLGKMGFNIAHHLAEKFELIVTDINIDVLKSITHTNIETTMDYQRLIEQSDVVLLSLPNSSVIESLLLKEEKLINYLKPNQVVIDLSSSSPTSTQKIAALLEERHVHFIDAPLSGGPEGAATGNLTIMTAGNEEIIQQYQYVFDAIGNNVFYIGKVGSGHAIKAINNLLYGAIFIASCEAVALGNKVGISKEKLIEVISVSAGRNFAIDTKFKNNLLKGDFTPGFTTDLLIKDMNIALDFAQEKEMALTISKASYDLLEKGQQEGLGKLDHTAVYQLFEK